MPRLFTAIDLTDDARDQLQVWFRDFTLPGMRKTRPGIWHLTTHFIGDVDEDRVEQFAEAVPTSVAATTSFQMSVTGFACLPDTRRPRVFVMETDTPTTLTHLVASTSAVLAPLGFTPDERPCRPHITLGRFRGSRRRWHIDLSRIPPLSLTWPIDHLTLYRSTLTPDGPIYDVVRRAAFAVANSSSNH